MHFPLHYSSNLIRTSGSAFPATLAFQIRQLERDTNGDFKLEAIITVVDAENFIGYEDTSPTAKMQASYTDLILIVRMRYFLPLMQTNSSNPQNKWEFVSERSLDIVMDHLYTLNDETPKIKCQGKNGVDVSLVFGIESKLSLERMEEAESTAVHDEVETVTVFKGRTHSHGVEALQLADIDKDRLIRALSTLPRESVWRAKGFVKLSDGNWVSVNWAFGRYDVQGYTGGDIEGTLCMTLMGSRESVREAAHKFTSLLEGELCGD